MRRLAAVFALSLACALPAAAQPIGLGPGASEAQAKAVLGPPVARARIGGRTLLLWRTSLQGVPAFAPNEIALVFDEQQRLVGPILREPDRPRSRASKGS